MKHNHYFLLKADNVREAAGIIEDELNDNFCTDFNTYYGIEHMSNINSPDDKFVREFIREYNKHTDKIISINDLYLFDAFEGLNEYDYENYGLTILRDTTGFDNIYLAKVLLHV